MSDAEGCSSPKKQKFFPHDDSDTENELFIFYDGSDDDLPDNDDDAEDSDEKDQKLTFSAVAIGMSSPSSSVKNEQLLLGNKCGNIMFNLPSTGDSPQPTESSSWSSTSKLKDIPFKKQNIFFGNPGSEPVDFFNFFFEDKLLLYICEKTNAQAAKLMRLSTATQSRIKSWKELKISELRIFLGLLFHMGTIKLPRLQDYWKADRLFAIPIFRQQMGRNRFLLIMRCLHFTSEAENASDTLFKIRHVIDYFNHKMETCYYPAKELGLDESMVLWKGRLRFKNYFKNKQHKYRLKVFMLTEPDGLVQKFQVFTGNQAIEDTDNKHAETVVMQLLENKLQSGHSLYMSNNYNSVGLAKKLLDHNTYCTGILRKDSKGNPVKISRRNVEEGENVAFYKNGVVVGKWKDKRSVMYISTEFPAEMMQVTTKRGQAAKPIPIVKYNDVMSGVDLHEQLMAFYPCERKSFRWYLKLAIHTFQLLFMNSYKIFNKYSGIEKKMSLYDYRLAVINQLLLKKSDAVTGPSVRKVQKGAVHKISRITERNLKGKLKRKMCRQCSKSHIRKDSFWHCTMCKNQPGLCVECFHIYHNL